MDAIKFRIWNRSGGFFDSPMYQDWKKESMIPYKQIKSLPLKILNKESVCSMIWTGFKDCQGTEIYEGDIVTSKEYPFSDDETDFNYIAVIEMDLLCPLYTLYCVNPERRGISEAMASSMDWEIAESFKVIGNVFEIPEQIQDQFKYDWEQQERIY